MKKLLANDSFPIRFYASLNRYSPLLISPVLLLMRLSWGLELAQSGFGHLTHVQATLDNFIKWGVPMPHANVYISGCTELIGGSLLLAGLATRLIAIPLVFNFVVAIIAASRHHIADAFAKQGWLDGWTTIVDDTAFPFLILALVMLALGPGRFSIDYLLGRKLFCKH